MAAHVQIWKKKSEKIILLDELNRNVKKPLKLEEKKRLGQ